MNTENNFNGLEFNSNNNAGQESISPVVLSDNLNVEENKVETLNTLNNTSTLTGSVNEVNSFQLNQGMSSSAFNNFNPSMEPNENSMFQNDLTNINPVENIPNNGGNKKIVLIIVSVLIACVALVVGIILMMKPKEKEESEISSSSFFLQKDMKYAAIFSEEGKQLTDFIYDADTHTYFINHSVNVKNDKGEVGVINDQGKTIIEFGKYKSISRVGGMYKVTDEDLNTSLFDAKGKKFMDIELLSIEESGDYFFVLSDEDKYKLINYKGKTLLELKKQGEEDIYVDSGYDYEKEIVLYYNGNNYIIDLINEKVISEFKAEKPYCIKSKKDGSNNSYIMETCDSGYSSDNYPYILIKNGNYVKDFDYSTCSNLYYIDNKDAHLTCSNGYEQRYMDDEGNVLAEVHGLMAFIDKNNYAVVDTTDFSNRTIEIYKNGEVVKELQPGINHTLHDRLRGAFDRFYICDSEDEYESGYRLYDTNGEAFGDYYKSIDSDGMNGYTVACKEKQECYIINNKAEKVTESFKWIQYDYSGNNYFIVSDLDDNISILDKKLKVVIEGLEDIGSFKNNNMNVYKKDGKHVIVSFDELKIIFESEHYINLKGKYFEVYESDDPSLYSYKTFKKFSDYLGIQ